MSNVNKFIFDKIRKLVAKGMAPAEISRRTGYPEHLIVTLGKLRNYELPPDFVTTGADAAKRLSDPPDTHWEMDLVEEYNETPPNARMGLGTVPAWHNLKMADPFNCPKCGKVTLFSFEDSPIRHVYTMHCTNKCGHSFPHDCTPR